MEVVANDTGDRLTPTTVQWTPTQSLVGRSAVLEQFRHAANTVYRAKQVTLPQSAPYRYHVSGLASQLSKRLGSGSAEWEMLHLI